MVIEITVPTQAWKIIVWMGAQDTPENACRVGRCVTKKWIRVSILNHLDKYWLISEFLLWTVSLYCLNKQWGDLQHFKLKGKRWHASLLVWIERCISSALFPAVVFPHFSHSLLHCSCQKSSNSDTDTEYSLLSDNAHRSQMLQPQQQPQAHVLSQHVRTHSCTCCMTRHDSPFKNLTDH